MVSSVHAPWDVVVSAAEVPNKCIFEYTQKRICLQTSLFESFLCDDDGTLRMLRYSTLSMTCRRVIRKGEWKKKHSEVSYSNAVRMMFRWDNHWNTQWIKNGENVTLSILQKWQSVLSESHQNNIKTFIQNHLKVSRAGSLDLHIVVLWWKRFGSGCHWFPSFFLSCSGHWRNFCVLSSGYSSNWLFWASLSINMQIMGLICWCSKLKSLTHTIIIRWLNRRSFIIEIFIKWSSLSNAAWDMVSRKYMKARKGIKHYPFNYVLCMSYVDLSRLCHKMTRLKCLFISCSKLHIWKCLKTQALQFGVEILDAQPNVLLDVVSCINSTEKKWEKECWDDDGSRFSCMILWMIFWCRVVYQNFSCFLTCSSLISTTLFSLMYWLLDLHHFDCVYYQLPSITLCCQIDWQVFLLTWGDILGSEAETFLSEITQ